MKHKPLNEQVVVVFGASSGIGRDAALRFAEKGARVVAVARGDEGLDSLVSEIRASGGKAIGMVADAAHFGQVKAVADETVRRYGRLDTWAHVAAVAIYATAEQTTPDEFREVIQVNLLGQVHGAKAALPYLKAAPGGGTVIFVSSVEAMRPLPYHAAYAASKHGVHAFAQTLRLELIHDNAPVRVTEILPPSINTPLFETARTRIGVQPAPMPPVYPVALVTDALLHAAQHPVREMVLGGVGKQMVAGQRLSPRLMDAILERVGFKAQQTDEPKDASAPDTLSGPVSGAQDRVEGRWKKMEKWEAAAPWLQRNRLALLGTAALLGGTVLATRPVRQSPARPLAAAAARTQELTRTATGMENGNTQP